MSALGYQPIIHHGYGLSGYHMDTIEPHVGAREAMSAEIDPHPPRRQPGLLYRYPPSLDAGICGACLL